MWEGRLCFAAGRKGESVPRYHWKCAQISLLSRVTLDPASPTDDITSTACPVSTDHLNLNKPRTGCKHLCALREEKKCRRPKTLRSMHLNKIIFSCPTVPQCHNTHSKSLHTWRLKLRMQQSNKQCSWSSQKTYIISAMKQMGDVALNITHYCTAHEYWTAKFMEESGLPFFYCYSCSHCFRCCILNWHWNGLLMCVSVKQKRIMFSYVTLNFASVLRAVCVPKDSVKVNLVKLVHCHWSQTAFIFLLQRQFWLNYYIFVYWLL